MEFKMIKSGLALYNSLQIFTFDLGQILMEHSDYTDHQLRLDKVLAQSDPSPFVQAVTAFQFARLFARDEDLQKQLDELEEQLHGISQFYQTRLSELKVAEER